MAFYSDIGFRAYQTRVSNYFLSFAHHIAIYRNATLVATVDLDLICWC